MPTMLGGRYQIVREIGRGGMATVYLAEDPKHGRQVAVKTLRSELARRIGRVRFAREIEIAAGLRTPTSCRSTTRARSAPTATSRHSCTSCRRSPAGDRSATACAASRALPPDEVVRLGGEIALALDYAHRRGVIHLDIKPENILLQEGHAVIADFGIARAISEAGEIAGGRAPILGTPSYMSPEQAPARRRRRPERRLLPRLRAVRDHHGRAAIRHARSPRARRRHGPMPTSLTQYVSRRARERRAPRDGAVARDERFATAGSLAAALADAGRRALVADGGARGSRSSPAAIAAALPAGYLVARGQRRASTPTSSPSRPSTSRCRRSRSGRKGSSTCMSRSLDGAGAVARGSGVGRRAGAGTAAPTRSRRRR